MTSELFGFDAAAAPTKNRFWPQLAIPVGWRCGMWLHRCRRAGSSDAKFDMKSLVANDFGLLFANIPVDHAGCTSNGPRLRSELFERTGRRRRGGQLSTLAVDQPRARRQCQRVRNCKALAGLIAPS